MRYQTINAMEENEYKVSPVFSQKDTDNQSISALFVSDEPVTIIFQAKDGHPLQFRSILFGKYIIGIHQCFFTCNEYSNHCRV